LGQSNPSIFTAVISAVTLRLGWVLTLPHPDWVQIQTRRSRLEATGERLRHLVKAPS
jgi:Flp pilus assembly CpaF family ATPase